MIGTVLNACWRTTARSRPISETANKSARQGPRIAGSLSTRKDICDFLKRIGYQLTDDIAFGMVEGGLESGFPPCCVAFFVLLWRHAVLAPCRHLDEELTGDYRKLLDKARAQGRLEPGYVPCPACLLTILAVAD